MMKKQPAGLRCHCDATRSITGWGHSADEKHLPQGAFVGRLLSIGCKVVSGSIRRTRRLPRFSRRVPLAFFRWVIVTDLSWCWVNSQPYTLNCWRQKFANLEFSLQELLKIDNLIRSAGIYVVVNLTNEDKTKLVGSGPAEVQGILQLRFVKLKSAHQGGVGRQVPKPARIYQTVGCCRELPKNSLSSFLARRSYKNVPIKALCL